MKNVKCGINYRCAPLGRNKLQVGTARLTVESYTGIKLLNLANLLLIIL